MTDPATGVPYTDFDTPVRIANGVEGIIAGSYELDPVLRDLLTEYATRLRAMALR